MKIFYLIDQLKEKHKENTIVRNNGTLLLNPGKIPKAQHIFYEGLSFETIEEFLIKEYKNVFPAQYLKFLKRLNGIELFMFKIILGKISFAGSSLTIYGLPKTPPFNRPIDMEEPFDLRIEDLRRHDNIPQSWLKIGTYQLTYTLGGEADIFIDCDTQCVYSTKRDQDKIEECWDSFDDCMCDLYKRFQNSDLEYVFKK